MINYWQVFFWPSGCLGQVTTKKKKTTEKNGITRPRPDGRVITSVYFRMLFPAYLNASMVSWS